MPTYEVGGAGGGAAAADGEALYAVPSEAAETSAAAHVVLPKLNGAPGTVVEAAGGGESIYGTGVPVSPTAAAAAVLADSTMVAGTMVNNANVGTGVIGGAGTGVMDVPSGGGASGGGGGRSRLPSAVLLSAEKQKELEDADSFYAEFPNTPTSGQ